MSNKGSGRKGARARGNRIEGDFMRFHNRNFLRAGAFIHKNEPSRASEEEIAEYRRSRQSTSTPANK